jgi:hypothetical protein
VNDSPYSYSDTYEGSNIQSCAFIESTNGLYLSPFVCTYGLVKESIMRKGEFNDLDG